MSETLYDLGRLRLLGELRRRGTMAAVADALGYSASTVSHQLALLEAEAGVPLLEPDGRTVRLTEAGEILAGHVDLILDAVDRARSDVAASLDEVAGTVRIGAFQTAALAIVPPALARLSAAHPRLRVRLRHLETEDALPALAARELDLVVAEEYPGAVLPRSPELEVAELARDPLRLALPRGSTVDPAAPLASLRDHAWAMEPQQAASRAWATALCRETGFEPDVRFEASDLLLQAELARRGLAAAILPGLLLGFADQGVVLVDLGPVAYRRLLLVTRRGGHGDPALAAVGAALRGAL
jgi:DNA-binding transcriptional LysR family regulator